MRNFFPAIILLSMLAVQFGCSGNASNTANADANANTAKVSPYAHITDPNAALAEGDQLLDNNRTEDAIEAYKQAVTLNPDFAEAYFKMGIAYALIESEMQRSGANIETSANAGKDKVVKTNSQKAFERAIEAYKKVIAANSKDDVAQFNLGRAYNKLNKDEEAETAFAKLSNSSRTTPSIKQNTARSSSNSPNTAMLDFVQRDDSNTKRSNSNTAANANTASNSNTATKPSNSNTKVQRDEPREKNPRGRQLSRRPEQHHLVRNYTFPVVCVST
ncbi:MAG: tetratricopeptide repeat protein [Chloracidobacterium sp.]|nr:tetratricopeptide repeat protein [Chloracidobacterium sp.]